MKGSNKSGTSIEGLYELYRSMGPEVVGKMSNEQVSKMFSGTIEELANDQAGSKALSTVFIIAAKIATQHDLETFRDFLENGETPPLKLSKEEMEILKGGFFGGLFGKLLGKIGGKAFGSAFGKMSFGNKFSTVFSGVLGQYQNFATGRNLGVGGVASIVGGYIGNRNAPGSTGTGSGTSGVGGGGSNA